MPCLILFFKENNLFEVNMQKFCVALIANLKKNAPHLDNVPGDMWDDLDSETTMYAIREAIRSEGNDCEFFEGDISLYNNLVKYQPDICFNLCEGHFGDSREAQVPALLEMMRIPYTGSKVLPLALCLDKPMTKRILFWHELPTPEFQTFERIDEPLLEELKFPLFVKPSREGTGMGVSAQSIVNNESELRERLDYVLTTYKQEALVETFIEGREITVGMVGNLEGPAARRLPDDLSLPRIIDGLQFMPPLEVDLNDYLETDIVYSNRLKVEMPYDLTYLCPAPLDEVMVHRINWLAAAVFRVTGCSDMARVDFRLDVNDNWKPYILEINPLPGLTPGISDIVMEAQAIGIGHTELINRILNAALKRYGMI
jgi:D-alanine-D-alanine ligase